MARTEMMERIGGEPVRVVVDIGVIEAVAAVEDEIMVALAKLQRASYRVTRAAVVAMTKAAGRDKPDVWFDEAVTVNGLAPYAMLAFTALGDAFAKASEAAAPGKAEAAAETTPTAS